MKNTNNLKNIFLGIIAINLTLITLTQIEVFLPKAYASETNQPINTNYGLVPLNENGNVNVEVVGNTGVIIRGWSEETDGTHTHRNSQDWPLPVRCR